ncbi:MAG: hypothetical protein K2J82_03385 [Muribaculaceae bacterium]|nr:hypothetical protein [Muribaculaceae bacterium]
METEDLDYSVADKKGGKNIRFLCRKLIISEDKENKEFSLFYLRGILSDNVLTLLGMDKFSGEIEAAEYYSEIKLSKIADNTFQLVSLRH